MKPSDGEIEFLQASDVRLGAGTKARVAHIEAKKRSEATEIIAVLELRATVRIVPRYCGCCSAEAPPPDDDGLWYILQNHDGARLVFSEPADETYAKPERDQYPAEGWKRLDDMDVCSDCWSAVQEALKARRRK